LEENLDSPSVISGSGEDRDDPEPAESVNGGISSINISHYRLSYLSSDISFGKRSKLGQKTANLKTAPRLMNMLSGIEEKLEQVGRAIGIQDDLIDRSLVQRPAIVSHFPTLVTPQTDTRYLKV
jgi:hypothetical protein